MDIIQLIGFIITIIAMTIVTRRRARDARQQRQQRQNPQSDKKQKQEPAANFLPPTPKMRTPRPRVTVHQPDPAPEMVNYVMPKAIFDEPQIVESSRVHDLVSDKMDLRRGIILSEILGKPKALQK